MAHLTSAGRRSVPATQNWPLSSGLNSDSGGAGGNGRAQLVRRVIWGRRYARVHPVAGGAGVGAATDARAGVCPMAEGLPWAAPRLHAPVESDPSNALRFMWSMTAAPRSWEYCVECAVDES